jgi:hypothetical protein
MLTMVFCAVAFIWAIIIPIIVHKRAYRKGRLDGWDAYKKMIRSRA